MWQFILSELLGQKETVIHIKSVPAATRKTIYRKSIREDREMVLHVYGTHAYKHSGRTFIHRK